MIPALTIVPKRDINGPGSRDYSSRDTIYVSPTGKDGYLGYTPELPTKTLDNVKEITQKLKTGPSKDLKVEFLGGKYTARDFFFKNDKFTYFKHYENGNNNYSLTFKPYSNQYVEFDNSTSYTGFVSAGSLWKIKINESDIRKCNMFGFVNGIRSVPARFPKYGNLSEYTKVTYGGQQYIKIPDSSGFLKCMQSYLTAGNNPNSLGGFYTLGFEYFGNTYLQTITANPPGSTFEENVFYIKPSVSNLSYSYQFFANQSSIYQPRYSPYEYYSFNTDIRYYQLTAAPDFIINYLGYATVQDYVNDIETLGIVNDIYNYENTTPDGGTIYYFNNTPLQTTIDLNPPGTNWFTSIAEGNVILLDPYLYKPSNLDPYIVCTVKGENTIILENNEYWFYYKPSTFDVTVGIQNSILETYDAGNTSQWLNSGSTRTSNSPTNGAFKYGLKTADGYSYTEGDNFEGANSVGFNFTSPQNIKLLNLNFKHCLVPITLNTPSSAYSTGAASIDNFISEFTGNISITGCNMYYNFGSALVARNLKNTSISKNLIYSAENNGLSLMCGRDIVIENNIVKNTQHVNTTFNGENGIGLGNIRVSGEYFNNTHDSRTLTGAKVSNNDLSYGGNNLCMGAMRSVSAFNNRIRYAGFGANNDMGAMYDGFSYVGGEETRNKYYNNFVSYARAATNNSFLGNLVYLDGNTNGPYFYNNILAFGQTGIQHTSLYFFPNFNLRSSGVIL